MQGTGALSFEPLRPCTGYQWVPPFPNPGNHHLFDAIRCQESGNPSVDVRPVLEQGHVSLLADIRVMHPPKRFFVRELGPSREIHSDVPLKLLLLGPRDGSRDPPPLASVQRTAGKRL